MFHELQNLKIELSKIIDGNPGLSARTRANLCDAESSLLSAIEQIDKAAQPCSHPADKVRNMGGGWMWCMGCGERWKE